MTVVVIWLNALGLSQFDSRKVSMSTGCSRGLLALIFAFILEAAAGIKTIGTWTSNTRSDNFAISPQRPFCSSSGQRFQYGLITLAYQRFTTMLLYVVVDLWQFLSKWSLILSECVLLCRRENVGPWIRALSVRKFLASKRVTVLEHTP
jgi:hypothetical protein